MSDARKEIAFFNSMTANKRADSFAYLRRNVLSTDQVGLYPAVDFWQRNPTLASAAYSIVDILGSTQDSFDIKVIVDTGAGATKFFNLGSSSESNTEEANEVECAAFGSDGVYAVFDDNIVRQIQHANSNVTEINVPIGSSTTRFDISNVTGSTWRYTWDGTGTNPQIKDLRVGMLMDIDAQNFDADNNGNFQIVAIGSNYFDVVNPDGVAEVDKTIGTGSITPIIEASNVEVGGFDGLQYWWVGTSIYSQLPDQAPILIADGIVPSSVTICGISFFNEFLIIFAQSGSDIYVFFHDKGNSTFFTYRYVIKNAIFLGGGVVGGKLTIFNSVGNSHNLAEGQGTLNVSQFDGEKFVVVNSIVGAREDIEAASTRPYRTFAVGSDVMLVGVDNQDLSTNFKTDIFQNYLYKIHSDGSIEAQTLPLGGVQPLLVRIQYDFSLYVITSSSIDTIYINQGSNDAYTEYTVKPFTETTYITNFLEDPHSYHRLDALSFTFEKLYRNGATSSATDETLEVYYRVSDRQNFTLIATITAQDVIDYVNARLANPGTVPLNEQRFQITKMLDGSALPEFNEIQFKLVSKNGMSLIGAFYDYSFITRNTLSS